MKKMIPLLLCALHSANAFCTQAFEWDGTPINLTLAVGEERLIRLPDNAQFRLPTELANQISVTSASGILYVTAYTPITDVPLDIRLVESGAIIKTRLTTINEGQDNSDVKISLPKVPETSAASAAPSKAVGINAPQQFDPIAMIRFAATRNLMPQHLWPKSGSITQIPTPKQLRLDQLFYGASAGVFDAKILETYRQGSMVLSVIHLTNKTPFPAPIDFGDISIAFDFASVPEPYFALGVNGSTNDFSIMYLITQGELAPLVLQVDPSALPLEAAK
ncbi:MULTISPECIES: DUF3438 family protein [Shewanella]|uniref:DUF3438 family protein n=1 Tax=Shewanella TaxID=22 RepID=UPI0024478E70|nr:MULTISPECIES: DUF3438 family protein [Shewanella]MDH0451026.1 DUF3438 family protein [Shewanella sp. GD04112]